MSLTILEVLENAEYNLSGPLPFQQTLAKEQLSNALKALNNGYDLYEDFDESMLDGEKPEETLPNESSPKLAEDTAVQ